MGVGRHRRPDGRPGAERPDPETLALRRLQDAGVGPARGWVPERPTVDDLADRLPPIVRAAWVAPAGRAVAGLALLVALAVAAALVATWLSRPHEEPLPDRSPVGARLQSSAPASAGPSAATSSGSSAGPAPSPTRVWVHVAGAVRRPGVVELPSGARVADAVRAAGGPTRSAQPASVNLARVVVDGEQVVVARRGESVAAAPGSPTGPGAPATGATAPATGPVDLNTASIEALDTLPGIGPVLAQRILDWRTANGRFTAVDELGEVSGIGEATLADLRPVVTV